MKKIRLLVAPPSEEQLAEVTENLDDKDKREVRKNMTLHYKKLVQTVLRTPFDQRAGISIEEMEKSLKILKLVSKVEDEGILEIEDADWEFLVQKLEAVRWNAFDERIVSFVHAIKNATQDVLDESSGERTNGHVKKTATAKVA